MRKIKILFIGIAGTNKDFLLAVPVLHAYIQSDPLLHNWIDVHSLYLFQIHDKHISFCTDKIISSIEKFNPDIISFSIYSWNYTTSLNIVNKLRHNGNDSLILFGGPEIAVNHVSAGNFDDIPVDFIICGEGEIPLHKLLHYLVNPDSISLNKIPRLAYRKGDKIIFDNIINLKNDILNPLSNAPSPYLTGIIPKTILTNPGIRANIETQRGCNYKCAYCVYHKGFSGIRYRDPSTVINELKFIYQNGIKSFRITDANFFSNELHAMKIINGMISNELHMFVFFEVIPQYISDELITCIDKFINANIGNRITIGIGLQSINQDSLKRVRRNTNVSYFDKAVTKLLSTSAIVKIDIILGLPLETFQSYIKLIEFLLDRCNRGYVFLSLSVLRILPGSDMEQIAEEEGLTIDTTTPERFVYETKTLTREEMVTCLRYNVIIFRIFSTMDTVQNIATRDHYYRVKENLGISHIILLDKIIKYLWPSLLKIGSNFCIHDFPNAEEYYRTKSMIEITDEMLHKCLIQIKNN